MRIIFWLLKFIFIAIPKRLLGIRSKPNTEKKQRGCWKVLRRISISVIVLILALFGCGLFAQFIIERDERLAPTRTIEAMTQTVLDVYASSTQAILDRYATQTQTVLDGYATQTAIVDATLNADEYNTKTTIAKTWTRTPTPTKTPVPSRTPIPTRTNTPRPTEVRVVVTEIRSQTFYVQTQGARGRSCPTLQCSVNHTFNMNESIRTSASADGANVNGSTRWYRVQVDGNTVWIHSSLVSSNRVRATLDPNSPAAQCGGRSTCGEMSSCAQAYACLAAGYSRLDRDGDGIPCESICR